ncbi:hypothetical protein NR798_24185 [Archangium gephyra]|uniref:hypothetical protein n=1 Tax=Archangium gephyra TaxID=48 RepID=UPI0035D44E1D
MLDEGELLLLAVHAASRQADRELKAQRAAENEEYRRQREEQDAARRRELLEAGERAELEGRPRTPCLPPYKRRNRGLYVLAEDLDELIPDGWGAMWPEECERLGARMGVPPLAVPYLMILEWVHGLRPAVTRRAKVMGTGCGLQHTPEWMARKLGCTPRWAKEIQARLDPVAEYRRELRRVRYQNAWREKNGQAPLPEPKRPEGVTCYVHRFQKLRHYGTLTRDLPAAQRRPRWLCRAGKLRRFCDVQGVTYPTLMGCRLLRRRAHRRERPRQGHRPKLRRSPMQEDLYQRLSPIYRRLRARLAPPLLEQFTPLTEKPSVTRYVRPPAGCALRPRAGAGPPG